MTGLAMHAILILELYTAALSAITTYTRLTFRQDCLSNLCVAGDRLLSDVKESVIAANLPLGGLPRRRGHSGQLSQRTDRCARCFQSRQLLAAEPMRCSTSAACSLHSKSRCNIAAPLPSRFGLISQQQVCSDYADKHQYAPFPVTKRLSSSQRSNVLVSLPVPLFDVQPLKQEPSLTLTQPCTYSVRMRPCRCPAVLGSQAHKVVVLQQVRGLQQGSATTQVYR